MSRSKKTTELTATGLPNLAFNLVRINFAQVLEKYRAGGFSGQRRITPAKKSSITVRILDPISSNPEDGHYQIRDKYGYNIVVACAGHQDLQQFHIDGRTPIGGRCDYCKDDIEGKCIGIPTKCYEEDLLYQGAIKTFTIFYVQGRHCSFECALACIRREIQYFKGQIYENAEEYLRRLHQLMTGGILVPRAPLGLRLSEGGCLPDSQWKKTTTTYVLNPNIVLIPMKTEYLCVDS